MSAQAVAAEAPRVFRPSIESPALRQSEVAKIFSVSESWLEKCRMNEEGPPYYEITPRCIRYLKAELDEWFAKRRKSFN